MLEIRIHCPSNCRYQPARGSAHPIDLVPGDVLDAGEHNLVKLIALPADFAQVVEEERSRDGRGKLLVSGKAVQGNNEYTNLW
jgi:hypothetical protein